MARSYRQLKFYDRSKDLKGPGVENLQMPAVPNFDASQYKLPNENKPVLFKKIRSKFGKVF